MSTCSREDWSSKTSAYSSDSSSDSSSSSGVEPSISMSTKSTETTESGTKGVSGTKAVTMSVIIGCYLVKSSLFSISSDWRHFRANVMRHRVGDVRVM